MARNATCSESLDSGELRHHPVSRSIRASRSYKGRDKCAASAVADLFPPQFAARKASDLHRSHTRVVSVAGRAGRIRTGDPLTPRTMRHAPPAKTAIAEARNRLPSPRFRAPCLFLVPTMSPTCPHWSPGAKALAFAAACVQPAEPIRLALIHEEVRTDRCPRVLTSERQPASPALRRWLPPSVYTSQPASGSSVCPGTIASCERTAPPACRRGERNLGFGHGFGGGAGCAPAAQAASATVGRVRDRGTGAGVRQTHRGGGWPCAPVAQTPYPTVVTIVMKVGVGNRCDSPSDSAAALIREPAVGHGSTRKACGAAGQLLTGSPGWFHPRRFHGPRHQETPGCEVFAR